MHLLRELARGGIAPVVRRTIQVTTPAAGAGITLVPEAGRAWQVESITALLTTSSQVANRLPELTLTGENRVLWTIPAVAVQAASLAVTYSWIAGYPTPTTTVLGLLQAMPLPPVILVPGWTLGLGIAIVDAGDQLTVVNAQVLESFTGRTEAEYDLARRIEHRAEAIAEALGGEVTGA